MSTIPLKYIDPLQEKLKGSILYMYIISEAKPLVTQYMQRNSSESFCGSIILISSEEAPNISCIIVQFFFPHCATYHDWFELLISLRTLTMEVFLNISSSWALRSQQLWHELNVMRLLTLHDLPLTMQWINLFIYLAYV